MNPPFSFKVNHTDNQARAGTAKTLHGTFETPCFMVIGTKAAIKVCDSEEMRQMGGQVILSNTYHLHLRPGEKLIQKMGGLHGFINWQKPMLTDSGGYQVFSLRKTSKITDEGVTFHSHIDGKKLFLGPKNATEIQYKLGADMIMCFDECPPYPSTKKDILKAIERTTAWAKICKETLTDIQKKDPNIPALFGIVQGGIYNDLREISAKQLIEIDFPGYAIGGVSVREPKEKLYETVHFTTPLLPKEKIRYLMGIGQPEDILYAVEQGIDLFDCVLPTRNARHGTLYTQDGMMRISNKQYETDDQPIAKDCGCHTCQHFSRAYLRHLSQGNEPLGQRLNTLHNIYFYLDLMRKIREAIKEQRFGEFKREFLGRYLGKL